MATPQWWYDTKQVGTGGMTGQERNMMNQAYGIDSQVMSNMGLKQPATGTGQSTSWADGMQEYVAPPNQAIQQKLRNLMPGFDLYQKSLTGDRNAQSQMSRYGTPNYNFNMTRYTGPEGGYVASFIDENGAQQQYWMGEDGQAKPMPGGALNSAGVIGGPNSAISPGQFNGPYGGNNAVTRPTNISSNTLASNVMTGNYGNYQTVGQAGGMQGGGMQTNPVNSALQTGSTALNSLATMLGDPTVQATTESIRNRLDNPEVFSDSMRAQMAENMKARNADLRDRQMSDITARAGGAGIQAPGMNNSAVASLNAELARGQGQADLDSRMQQLTTNLGAEQGIQDRGLDWAGLLQEYFGDQMGLEGQLALSNNNNMWSWLLSRMGG